MHRIKMFAIVFIISLFISICIPNYSPLNIGTNTVKAEDCQIIATTPGRTNTLHWSDPAIKKNPPGFCSQQYTGKPSNGTITAKIDKTLIQAGNTLTITGSVTKMCSECDGYIYTCETFSELATKKTDNFFWYRFSCKDCPTDLPTQKKCEPKTVYNVGRIAAALYLIYSLFSSGSSTPGKSVDTAKANADAAREAAINAMNDPSIDAAIQDQLKQAAREAANAYNTAKAAGIAESGKGLSSTSIMIAGMASSIIKTDDTCDDCYSICSTTYETKTSMAPKCTEGSGTADVPIAYRNATYSCSQSYCGLWPNKKIKIEILYPNGNTLREDYTTTNSQGKFSYTITAPSIDGDFTAVVSVPNDY